MFRKTLIFAATCLTLLIIVGFTLVRIVRHEPDFYRGTAVPEGKERKIRSSEFFAQAGNFISFCQKPESSTEWDARFDEKSVNSFFDEGIGTTDKILPEGVSSPRISFQQDKIRLGFRYAWGPISTIVSIDMRVWLTSETNVVALELQGMRAGALPISVQSLRERLTNALRPHLVEVIWYRFRGNPVALLRFPSESSKPVVRLDLLELHQGMLRIVSRVNESGIPRSTSNVSKSTATH